VVLPPESVSQLLFKKYVDDNIQQFLTTLKELVTKHRNQDVAQAYDQKIIKLAINVAFLYKQKYVTKEQMINLRFTFRRVCSSVINTFRLKNMQVIDDSKLQRISDILTKFKNAILELIWVYLPNECVASAELIFEYFGSSDFLQFCFIEATETFKQMVFILSYFLEMT